MVDADDKDNTSSETGQGQSKGNDKLAETLVSVQEQLRAMNEANQATAQAILQMRQAQANAITKEETSDDLYDPKTLLNKAGDIMQKQLREERAKNAMIYNLGQEYPEIHSDSSIRQSVIEAQKGLRPDLQDTADGYEVAVLKAVAKHGLVPKSKRQVLDEDASSAPRSSASDRSRKKVKVSDDTKTIAAMMGLNTEDPETLKQLEKHANRDTYSKYRPVGG